MIARNPKRIPAVNGDDVRRPLNAIAFLPAAATLGNLLCGFLAIFCCLLFIRSEFSDVAPSQPWFGMQLGRLFPTYIAAGVYFIVAAMICDALDGRLARIARRTSEFGAQLDSVADVVSFGAAPVMLLFARLMQLARPAEEDPTVSALHWRLAMLSGLVFLSCAAIRLARYNAENVKDESGQKRFSGLPTPGAGGALVALILLHEHLLTSGASLWGVDWARVIRWSLGPAAFLLGILMVSRINYVHVFNVYVRREHPPIHLVWVLVAAIVGWFFLEIMLVLVAAIYVISGIVLHFVHRPAAAGAAATTAEDGEEPDE
jgi:CDP-diacylglycerol--serine O-phosphatidyltransferase